MALFKQVVDAYIASKDLDESALSRLGFWVGELGDREVDTITAEDIDAALVKLAARGRLRGGKRPTAAAGKPLAGSTINRYLTQAGSVFKHAKRMKLVPRAFVAPTRGIERTIERANPERYLSADEVVRLVAVARVVDRKWGKMTALIVAAYHTGLRVGSLLTARGKQLDLVAGTLTVPHTKNGDPITAGLSTAAIAELKRLPKVGRDELIFGNKAGKPFTYAPLWRRIAEEARLEGRVFHELRHGHGYQLARAGVSQQMIMKSMGHRTLTASARYAHASIDDKKAVIAKVFG
jgi:integrase